MTEYKLFNFTGVHYGSGYSRSPDFTAAAVLGNGEIVNDFNLHHSFIKGKPLRLFSSGQWTSLLFLPFEN